MRFFRCLAVCCIVANAPVWAVQAPSAYDPPVTAKASRESVNALPAEDVAVYLELLEARSVFSDYAGQNFDLRKHRDAAKDSMIGQGLTINLDSVDLFGAPTWDGNNWVYLGSVTSVDALALRIQVDLSALSADEELYIIDPTGPRAHGPYTAADQLESGRWLPTIDGDTAVLMVRSASELWPRLNVVMLSHFYVGFADAAAGILKDSLACNNPMACETNGALNAIASGVGLMVIPNVLGDSGVCTGTLINNPDTPAFEPYFITANHCVGTDSRARQMDIIWDFREDKCFNGQAPGLASLPRSNVTNLLKTTSTFDLTLLKLDMVPSGIYGRSYAGYDTRAIKVGEDITGIHHPDADPMKISYGTVRNPSYFSGYQKQILVHWDDGVTEPGSSGSCLLVSDGGKYYLVGVLSSGTEHQCGNTQNNVDWYGALRNFYPDISGWLAGTNPPPADDPVTTSDCPADFTFKDDDETLNALRSFRDKGLDATAPGQALTKTYYAAAPALRSWVEESPMFRVVFRTAALPFAQLGRWLR
ncbi:MAG: trypsin-like peptidase domain-containing protein [Candidatus Hydrogenedentes bacterium]|nr:trypsin-like peptidase domain-containing protein [Candidatus Hydrogenedentota bacterium]